MGGHDRAGPIKGNWFRRPKQIGGPAKRPDYGKKLETCKSDATSRWGYCVRGVVSACSILLTDKMTLEEVHPLLLTFELYDAVEETDAISYLSNEMIIALVSLRYHSLSVE